MEVMEFYEGSFMETVVESPKAVKKQTGITVKNK